MRKAHILILIIQIISTTLFGGDIATFVNLGFSKDSRYFVFAQYGVKQSNSGSYAQLFFVDVPHNTFAPYGQKTLSYDRRTEPGTFGLGALMNIIEENIALTVKYEIDHLNTGRILYHLMDGDPSPDALQFRDFITGDTYVVTLLQDASGSGKSVRSSFNITINIKKSSGKSKTFTIGRPAYERQGVYKYRIKQILCSPDERSFVFIIEKEEADTTGVNIRYMIETARFDF